MSEKSHQDSAIAKPDQALRDDVNILATLLGQVLQEQDQSRLFDQVEAARQAARRYRHGDPQALTALQKSLADLPAPRAEDLARAFSSFFSVINMAERVHRIRRYREQTCGPEGCAPDTLQDSLRRLRQSGFSAAQVAAQLGKFKVMPVMTAHPTEVNRRTHLDQEQRLARLLVDRIEQRAMTPLEAEANKQALREQITLMWQTAEEEAVGRSVADEREHVLYYLLRVIYRVVPAYYDNLRRAWNGLEGAERVAVPKNVLLRFGSWVGGDMDGNPLVGAETLRDTLLQQRQLIVDRYVDELLDLRRSLSQSSSRVNCSAALLQRLSEYKQRMPLARQRVPARHNDMPYRVFLRLVRLRLLALFSSGEWPFDDAAELLADLRLVAASLRENNGAHAGLHRVQALIYRVQTFGFHLATVDLRQDSLEHRLAVSALLGDAQFGQKTSAQRGQALSLAIRPLLTKDADPLALPALDLEHPEGQAALRALDVMRAIGEGQSQYGIEAIGPYIISMAQGPDDALAVLFLARSAGLVDAQAAVPLDVTPLFETVTDLAAAAQTMRDLFADPIYRQHLNHRHQTQWVMLGYSDSSKGDGLVASRWALYQAQEQLVALAAAQDIKLRIFHGRGGTISRGGSKPRQAVLAEPPGAVAGHLRVTEQGEIIHAKYGLRGTALHTLEIATGATLEASLETHCAECPAQAREIMVSFAKHSRQAFRALVFEDPDFYQYFREATPIDVIERMRIGSRPASRRAGQGVKDLRAIPWVFAWTQNRHLMTAWYGVGTGLEVLARDYAVEYLQGLSREWPFLANLLADTEMVLAKADLGIAGLYAALSPAVGPRIFAQIQAEYQRCLHWVYVLRGESSLLQQEPELQAAIALRNPYVDPMSLIQVNLLRRWRAGDRQDAGLERALHTTVRGIARGMQNAG